MLYMCERNAMPAGIHLVKKLRSPKIDNISLTFTAFFLYHEIFAPASQFCPEIPIK